MKSRWSIYLSMLMSFALISSNLTGCGDTKKETKPETSQVTATPTPQEVREVTEQAPTVPTKESQEEASIKTAVYNVENNSFVLVTNGVIPIEDEYLVKVLDENGEELTVNSRIKAAARYTLKVNEVIDTNKTYVVSYKDALITVTMPLPYSTAGFEETFTYQGDDLGVTYTPEETMVKVWAPTAQKVMINFYKSGDPSQNDIICTDDMSLLEQGVWMVKKVGDWKNTYYTFSVITEGKSTETSDPYGKSAGINGKRSMVLDMSTTNPEGWEKDVNPNKKNAMTDSIIYELHVRDYTIDEDSGVKNKGKYLGLTETYTTNANGDYTGLTYLTNLGVNYVHLMPIYDFGSVDETKEGDYNWGYDPVNFNTPEGSYSSDPADGAARVREVKQMVKTFHDNGIGVVMDVVYNHVYDAESFCYNVLVPKYFSRTNDYGEYINGSGCGNDTATERSMVKKYIVDSVNYWVEEYHMDGFRFDLSGLIDTETMNAVITSVHAKHPDVIFYGEGWDMTTTLTKSGYTLTTQDNLSSVSGLAMYNDFFRDNIRGKNGTATDGGFVSGNALNSSTLQKIITGKTDWASTPLQLINFNSCHDNNTLFDKLTIANGEKNTDVIAQKNKLAAAILFTSQGAVLFPEGEEILRSKEKTESDSESELSQKFESNSYRSGDSVNSIKWSSLADPVYKDMYEYYQGLIAFRKAHPSLRMTTAASVEKYITFTEGLPNGITAFSIDGAYPKETASQIYVMYNNTGVETEIDIPAGDWKIYVNSQYAGTESLGGARDKVTLQPYSALVIAKDRATKKTRRTTKTREPLVETNGQVNGINVNLNSEVSVQNH